MGQGAKRAIGAGAALLIAVLVWYAWVPKGGPARTLSGYVEGEALYLASPISGLVSELKVVRGQRVEAGAPLFVMDARSAGAQQLEAAADREGAKAQANAAAATARQLKATAAAAKVNADIAAATGQRYAALRRAKSGAVSAEDADRAEATARSSADQWRAAEAQAAAAAQQAAAAERAVHRAEGGLKDTSVKLQLLTQSAPRAARVEEVFYQQGEWVPANQPVLSLLPDARIKLRFFVPEKEIAAYQIGRQVRFRCDGCTGELTAKVNYVNPRPEYTPPVIYSRTTRDALVFLVEAVPADPSRLTPGQPVDVIPLAGEGAQK
jgi:HlyD family secretion protein